MREEDVGRGSGGPNWAEEEVSSSPGGQLSSTHLCDRHGPSQWLQFSLRLPTEAQPKGVHLALLYKPQEFGAIAALS